MLRRSVGFVRFTLSGDATSAATKTGTPETLTFPLSNYHPRRSRLQTAMAPRHTLLYSAIYILRCVCVHASQRLLYFLPAPSWMKASLLEPSSDHMRSSHRSTDLWLTDSAVCGAGEPLQMTSARDEILMTGRGDGGVNIFSASLVISIFSLSFFFFLFFSLVTPLDATLMHLFCSIEHIGMADFPRLGGALDQKLSLLSTTAGEKG